MKPLSVLLEHGATPTPMDLIVLLREIDADLLKDCILDAVSTARNPFIPGVILSVALTGAAEEAPERERRELSALRERVDELLLEILERVLQAIHGLPGNIDGCSEMLEPETMKMTTVARHAESFVGPLKLALRNPVQTDTLCTTPLVQEFMAHKFVSGLPGPRDGGGLVERAFKPVEEGASWHPCPFDTGLLADGAVGRRMQGGHEAECPSDTLLPGAQLVLVGIVAKPCSYYEVPALRMALDVVVYLAVLTLYGAVLLEQGGDAPTPLEISLAVYIAVRKTGFVF